MKLYILGNGFDLAHNLPTKYSDFKVWLENKKEYKLLLEELESMFFFNDGWKNFEEALAYPNSMIEKKYEKLDCLEYFVDSLKCSFKKWAYSIKDTNQFETMKKMFNFEEDSYFITFNYTPVLESNVYSIDGDRILHIHGYDIEHYYFDDASVEVGHGNKCILNGGSKIGKRLYKDTYEIYKKNEQFFRNIQFIDEVITIGFSFSLIDKLYFEKIKEENPSAIWKFGLFSKDTNALDNCVLFTKELKIQNYKTFYYDMGKIDKI